MNEIYEIRDKLRNKLSEHRFHHTLGVAYTAAALAMAHGCDIKKAELAGLLHDCAKYMSSSEMIAECGKYRLEISESERISPGLLHCKLGAYFAKNIYGVSDEDVLGAIACHTTGKPSMSLLEEIIYVADYIEPGRPELPYINEMRACAFRNLHLATFYEVKSVIEKLNRSGTVVDNLTKETYEFYQNFKEV